MNKSFLIILLMIVFCKTHCIAYAFEDLPITKIEVLNPKIEQNIPKRTLPDAFAEKENSQQNEPQIMLEGSLVAEEMRTDDFVSASNVKVVYLTDYQSGYVPKEAQLISEQGVNWNKWSHDVIKLVVKNSLSQLSFVVPMGTTYDVHFFIDENKFISDFNLEMRTDKENSSSLKDKNVLKNLSVFSTELKKINGSAILTYPQNAIRTKTEMFVSFQFVKNTLFVHVVNVAPDYDTRKKEGL